MSFYTDKDVSLLENCLTNFKIFSFNVKKTPKPMLIFLFWKKSAATE